MSLPHGRLSTEETDQVREYSADSAVEFVIKLEPAWSMEEDSPDQPSAVYSTEQPMSDNTSLLSLDSKHPCYLCPAAFVLVSSLELHLASVHGEKLHVVLPGSSTPDRCDAGDCSNTDIGKDVDHHGKGEMTTNKVDNHDDTGKDGKKNSKQNECDVCGKTFSRPFHLKRHKLLHGGAKSFVCHVCDRNFSQVNHLTRHMRVHTEERPYKCPHCDSAFKWSEVLQNHIKSIHEGHRPHVCDICGAAFPLPFTLTEHRRIHTGEKPHVCSDCGKGFTTSCSLKKHRLTHTGEKPHVCSVCGKGFSQSSSLKNHRLTHTGERPHSCPHCSAAFSRSDILKKHICREHQ